MFAFGFPAVLVVVLVLVFLVVVVVGSMVKSLRGADLPVALRVSRVLAIIFGYLVGDLSERVVAVISESNS